jgi:DNA polymerase III delta prime subunit
VEKAARAIVKRAAGQPWGRRRAITLINVDSAPPRAFDRLLATLEEARAPTTFILSACNLRNVRLAGVSRCDHFGLRPLAPEAAGSLLAPRLHALGARPDEEALDVLIAAGKGLPTRLNEICVQMAGRGALTLAVVRQTLDLNWIEEIAAHWRTVLSGKAAIYDALALSMNVAPEEQVRRRQAFLQHIYLHGLRGIPMSTIATEPAFLHRGKSFTGDLVQALKTYAESRGMSAEDIWYTLTRDCLAGDLAEAVAGTSQTPI